jgi:hypothetical protein
MSVSDTKVVIANLGQTLAIAHGAMLSAERTSAILKLADLAASNWAAPKPEQTPETKPKSETPTEPKIETVTQDLQGTRWKVIRFKKAGAQ